MASPHEAYTLFVGEIYSVYACGTNSRHFTVAAGSQMLELAVPRGSAMARVHFVAHAVSSDHWSAQLPLPARVDFEIRSLGGGGAAGGARGDLDGLLRDILQELRHVLLLLVHDHELLVVAPEDLAESFPETRSGATPTTAPRRWCVTRRRP